VGLTAVVHGNELNGVPCIHRVITDLDVRHLKGTVVAIPCVNVPGYLRFAREFSDGKDLNRLFPGKKDGTASEIFAYQLLHKIVVQFNYLIDLHTASFGRINSYYVRSDMNDPVSATMAKFQQPQIILHNSGQDGNYLQWIDSIRNPSFGSHDQRHQSHYCRNWESTTIPKCLCSMELYGSHAHHELLENVFQRFFLHSS
jgi:hypothetical protein